MKLSYGGRYKKGSSWENTVKKHLEGMGFFCVRQPVSAFPDLLAIPPIYDVGELNGVVAQSFEGGDSLFIECKVGGKLSKKEVEDLVKLTESYRVITCLCRPKYGAYSKKVGNVLLEEVK